MLAEESKVAPRARARARARARMCAAWSCDIGFVEAGRVLGPQRESDRRRGGRLARRACEVGEAAALGPGSEWDRTERRGEAGGRAGRVSGADESGLEEECRAKRGRDRVSGGVSGLRHVRESGPHGGGDRRRRRRGP
eukprot:2965022-Rhodomonas_salina.1